MRRAGVVAKYELAAQLRSPLLWVLMAALAFATMTLNPAAMVPTGDRAVGGIVPVANSVHALAQVAALSGFLFYPFFAALMAGTALQRDDEAGLGELLHATPLSATEYSVGKLAAVLGALGLALGLQLVLAIGWLELISGSRAAGVLGPFDLGAYATAFLVFALPAAGVSAGLGLIAAERARHVAAVWVCAASLFFVTLLVLSPSPGPGTPKIVATALLLLDPTGLHWLREAAFAVDRGALHYNTAPLPVDWRLVVNRGLALSWPALAALAAARHRRRFPLTMVARDWRPRWLRPAVSRPVGEVQGGEDRLALSTIGMGVRAPYFWWVTATVARTESRELLRQPSQLAFVPLAMLLVWEYAGSNLGVFDEPLRMTAGTFAVGTLEVLGGLLCLQLLFSTVASLERDRRSGLEPMTLATPAPTGALLAGKTLANLGVAGLVLLAANVAMVAVLLLQPGGAGPLWPLLVVTGGVLVPTLLVWTSAVVAVACWCRDRATTWAILLVVLAATGFAAWSGGLTWATNWPMWAALRWSDFGLFALEGRELWRNRLLMLVLAVVLAAFAVVGFDRTEADRARVGRRWARLRRVWWWALPASLVVVAGGAWLRRDVAVGFEGSAARARTESAWRDHVAAWSTVPAPTITSVDLELALDLDHGRLGVVGRYRLHNTTSLAMGAWPFTLDVGAPITWTVDGVALEVVDRGGFHVLEPGQALPPGGQAEVGFRYTTEVPRGASRNGGPVSQFVANSGVLLSTLEPNFVPLPGFALAPPAGTAEDGFEGAFAYRRDPVIGFAAPLDARMTVTAPSDFAVAGVGTKVAETTADGASVTTWQTDFPVRALQVVAGRLEVVRGDGVEVWFHPVHGANAPAMLETLGAARRRYSEWFGPYPWRDLRLVEYPNHVARAQGFATTISFSEGFGFLTKNHPGSSQLFVVTAHEAAHQWWGNLVAPANAPGADVLIEGMAHYATMLLLDVERGAEARRDFARTIETRFAQARRVDGERPLAQTLATRNAAEASAAYNKGSWVLWMLHQHLGHEVMLAGLREFVGRAVEGGPAPTLGDLIGTLRPRASDAVAFEAFVDQWIHGVGVPEFELREVEVTPEGETWRVTAQVANVGTGAAAVSVAVEGAVVGDASAREVRVVRLDAGEVVEVLWTTNFAPERLVVDPDVEVLQLNRERAVADL